MTQFKGEKVEIKASCQLKSVQNKVNSRFRWATELRAVLNVEEMKKEGIFNKWNEEVMNNCYRVQASEIIHLTQKYASKHSFPEAKNLITDFITQLKNVIFLKSCPMIQGILKKLEFCLERLSKEGFEESDRYYFEEISRNIMLQRPMLLNC